MNNANEIKITHTTDLIGRNTFYVVINGTKLSQNGKVRKFRTHDGAMKAVAKLSK
jgi:hypothetical protein